MKKADHPWRKASVFGKGKPLNEHTVSWKNKFVTTRERRHDVLLEVYRAKHMGADPIGADEFFFRFLLELRDIYDANHMELTVTPKVKENKARLRFLLNQESAMNEMGRTMRRVLKLNVAADEKKKMPRREHASGRRDE